MESTYPDIFGELYQFKKMTQHGVEIIQVVSIWNLYTDRLYHRTQAELRQLVHSECLRNFLKPHIAMNCFLRKTINHEEQVYIKITKLFNGG